MSEDLPWRDNLPDDLKTDASLADVPDVQTLAKNYIEGKRMIGSRIPLPKDDNDKAWDEIFTKLGRPESPDKYEIQRPENYDEGRAESLLKTAHEIGLNSKQVSKFLNWDASFSTSKAEAEREEAEAALKEEWGDNFEKNLAIAQRGIKEMGDGLIEFLDTSGLGNHPEMVKFALRIGKGLSEDKATGDGKTGLSMSQDEAKVKIAHILADPEDLYHAKYADKPGHKERVHQVEALFNIAYQ